MNKSDYANTVLIVFAIIGSGIAGALIVAGVWALCGTPDPRANVRLTRMQRVVTYLHRHGKLWRAL